jgi:hypothetical protein
VHGPSPTAERGTPTAATVLATGSLLLSAEDHVKSVTEEMDF